MIAYQIVNATNQVKKYKNMRGLRRSLNAVVKKSGYIGDTHAQHFYGKHLLNGLVNRCDIRFGLKLIINSKQRKENRIIPSSERWHLSGSGYNYCGAGKPAPHMMNQPI